MLQATSLENFFALFASLRAKKLLVSRKDAKDAKPQRTKTLSWEEKETFCIQDYYEKKGYARP
jgi:hypothetical protein